jgi:hypothetical protein
MRNLNKWGMRNLRKGRIWNLNIWGMRNLRKGGIWNLNKRGTRSLRERNQNQERELLCTCPPPPLDRRSPWASSCRPGGDQWSPQTALRSWTAGRPRGSRRKCWTGGRPNEVALAPAVALQERDDVRSPTPAVHTLFPRALLLRIAGYQLKSCHLLARLL